MVYYFIENTLSSIVFLKAKKEHNISQKDILTLYRKIVELDLDILSIINLCSYDDNIGFSLAQGE